MEIHEMVFLVSRATNKYASYRGKPVKHNYNLILGKRVWSSMLDYNKLGEFEPP